MKRHLAALTVIISFCTFSLFIIQNSKFKTVLNVNTPTVIQIDIDNNKTTDNFETVCIDNIEAFSLTPSDKFVNKYSKALNISRDDIISLGYLAQEYSQKTLENKKVSAKFTSKINAKCRYADIKLNGMSYRNLLANSGFGMIDNKIINKKNFQTNLEKARKLNLVIYNHHSGKYHKLDCPYGLVAHDSVILPLKQVPQTAKKCKICFNTDKHEKPVSYKKKSIRLQQLPTIIKPSLSATDGNIQIFYTDYTNNLSPNTNCSTVVCSQLINLINNSKSSIDIAIYGYENIPKITTALENAYKRGVNIRFVYDEAFKPENNYYKGNDIIKKFASAYNSDRSNSQNYTNMIMHNKFLIFDNHTVLTGSMNLSSSGLSDYDVNDIIIINSDDIANLYREEFEQMLEGKFHKHKSRLNINNKFKLNNTEIEIYFSPKDKVSGRIIELINNAKSYIYIPTYLITHKDISEALIKAKSRGIDVRVIIDANSTSTRNTKHKLLRTNGILLKTENYAGKLHSKTIIIDDEYIITGSMNFSNSGENKNDENILIIKNPEFAKSHKRFFLYLWTLIPNKYLQYNAKPESFDSIGSCTDGVDNNFNGKIDSEEESCKK